DERAVTAMLADRELNAWIAGQLRIAERPRGHERIVSGGDDERRDADAIDNPHRARAMVVIVGSGEAEVRRRVRLVELTNGADRAELRQVEATGPDAVLAPHARFQIFHEVPLIQEILAEHERANAFGDLDDRRHRGDAA